MGITGTLLAAGIYGASQLKIDFNMDKLLAIEEGSYQEFFLRSAPPGSTKRRLFEYAAKVVVVVIDLCKLQLLGFT